MKVLDTNACRTSLATFRTMQINGQITQFSQTAMTSLLEVVILGINLPNTVITHWVTPVVVLCKLQSAAGAIPD